MSPEQIVSARRVDARADVWSMGVVLYELLSGKPPFTGKTIMQLAVAIREDTPVPLRELRPEAPAALEAVIARCLSKDPAGRPANAAELAATLEAVRGPRPGGKAALAVSSEDGTTVSLHRATAPARGGPLRGRALALAFAAALVLGGGLIAVTLRPHPPGDATAPASTASAPASSAASGSPVEAVSGASALLTPPRIQRQTEPVPATSSPVPSSRPPRPERTVRAPAVAASASAAPSAAAVPTRKVFNEPIE
jgi:serine/threonine-protein kinase